MEVSLTLSRLQASMVLRTILSFAWANMALVTTETVVLRKKHNYSNQSRSSQCHHRHLAMHLTRRYLTRRLLAHCHLARRRHSQQQTSQIT